MPHFIVEINKELSEKIDVKKLITKVFNVALDSGLFSKSDIKSRLKVYDESIVAGENHNFIHVWGYIRQ